MSQLEPIDDQPGWVGVFTPEARQRLRQIALHAPTPEALRRARSNLKNLRKEAPELVVWIVVNGPAVASLWDDLPSWDDDSLGHLYLCPNTLKGLNLTAPASTHVLPQGAVLSLAWLQAAGWVYLRA